MPKNANQSRSPEWPTKDTELSTPGHTPGHSPGQQDMPSGSDEYDPDLTSGFFDDVTGELDEDLRSEELEELRTAEGTAEAEKQATPRGEDRRTGASNSASDSGSWSQSGVVDRRLGLDRRAMADAAGKKVDPNRRRGPGRRLSDFTRAAEEGEMTAEQFLFLKAIEAFKHANKKAYPSWTDVLEVVRLLGYRKTMPIELDLPKSDAEDWREAANAPSNVRPVRPEDREDGKGRDKKAA